MAVSNPPSPHAAAARELIQVADVLESAAGMVLLLQECLLQASLPQLDLTSRALLMA